MLVAATDTSTVAPTDADAVAAAVAALGPLDHEALLLRVRGRSLEEIASTTGTTTAMVRVRLHRAAAAVERLVGTAPTDGVPVRRDPDWPTDEVVVDAEVGITPVLHARLVAALDRSRAIAAVRHRRVAGLAQAVAEHAPQLASLATITGFAVAAAVAMATSA